MQRACVDAAARETSAVRLQPASHVANVAAATRLIFLFHACCVIKSARGGTAVVKSLLSPCDAPLTSLCVFACAAVLDACSIRRAAPANHANTAGSNLLNYCCCLLLKAPRAANHHASTTAALTRSS